MTLKISHKGLILVLISVFLQLGLIYTLSGMLARESNRIVEQYRAKAIYEQANALSKLSYDAGVAMGGYSMTKSPVFAGRFQKVKERIPQDVESLARLVSSDGRNQESIKNIRQITTEQLQILVQAKQVIDDNKVDVAQFRARHLYNKIRQLADQLAEEVRSVIEIADSEAYGKRVEIGEGVAEGAQDRQIIIAGVAVNLIMAIVLLLYFNSISRRLKIVSDNVAKLERGDTPAPAMKGSDEIAQLDAVVSRLVKR